MILSMLMYNRYTLKCMHVVHVHMKYSVSECSYHMRLLADAAHICFQREACRRLSIYSAARSI
jgi:hypothetical protein